MDWEFLLGQRSASQSINDIGAGCCKKSPRGHPIISLMATLQYFLLAHIEPTQNEQFLIVSVTYLCARCIDQIKDIPRVGNTCTRGCVWIGSLGTWYATISELNARDLREKANAILRWGQWDMRRVVKRFCVHNNTQDTIIMATNHQSEYHVTPPMRLSLSVRGRSGLRTQEDNSTCDLVPESERGDGAWPDVRPASASVV